MEEGLKEKDFPNLQQDHLSSIPPASLRGIVFQDFLAGDFPSPPLPLDAAARSPPDPVPFLPCKRSTKLSPAACRQKRMLKNRESASRSRARKQAYTTELEIEVAQLTDENARLKRQQEELKMAMASQAVAAPSTGPLQRTSTAPSTGPLQRTSTAPF